MTMWHSTTDAAGRHPNPSPANQGGASRRDDPGARAFALARWEDDGGWPYGLKMWPASSLSPDGRMGAALGHNI